MNDKDLKQKLKLEHEDLGDDPVLQAFVESLDRHNQRVDRSIDEMRTQMTERLDRFAHALEQNVKRSDRGVVIALSVILAVCTGLNVLFGVMLWREGERNHRIDSQAEAFVSAADRFTQETGRLSAEFQKSMTSTGYMLEGMKNDLEGIVVRNEQISRSMSDTTDSLRTIVLMFRRIADQLEQRLHLLEMKGGPVPDPQNDSATDVLSPGPQQ